MTQYSKVRLIGFALPTTPSSIIPVGSMSGPGAVAGTYPAFEDLDEDIAARLDVMSAAVDTAYEQISKQDDAGVLNVFVAPEFFWHSNIGPYVFGSKDADPADQILDQLKERFPAEKYPNTLFVFGTVISALVDDLETVLNDASLLQRNNVVKAMGEAWGASTGAIQAVLFNMLVEFVKLGHSYPLVEVRNRALIVGSELLQGVGTSLSTTTATTEKYYASNEDFLLWDVTGKPVITEQVVAYPHIDLSGGDLKVDALDSKAIFDVTGGPTVGVEICLDHSDVRLRRSALRSPWPAASDGVKLHLVPSCGMQLLPSSVAAVSGGLAFSCDGEYGLDGAESGEVKTSDPLGVESIHVSYVDGGNTTYGAHTQLTRVARGPVGENPAAPGSKNATFAAPDVDVSVFPVTRTAKFDSVYAGGPGAVHLYGLTQPLAI